MRDVVPIDQEVRLAMLLRRAALRDMLGWDDLPARVQEAWLLTTRAIVAGLADGSLYAKIGR